MYVSFSLGLVLVFICVFLLFAYAVLMHAFVASH